MKKAFAAVVIVVLLWAFIERTLIGKAIVAYFKKVHGKRKLFHVKGIITPKSCPRGGWPVASQFSFLDGQTVMSTSKIPCPK